MTPGTVADPLSDATMQPFTEHNATDIVVASLAESRSKRFQQVMTSMNLAPRTQSSGKYEPTTAEWMTALDFLTRTGQICDEKRQEFILLSDVLGVSMLVDAVNHRRPSGATESTVLGPFHVPDAPALPMGANISKDPGGEPVLVRGTICDTDGRPIDGAIPWADVRGSLQDRVALLSSLRVTSSGAVRPPRRWQGRSHESEPASVCWTVRDCGGHIGRRGDDRSRG